MNQSMCIPLFPYLLLILVNTSGTTVDMTSRIMKLVQYIQFFLQLTARGHYRSRYIWRSRYIYERLADFVLVRFFRFLGGTKL